MSASTNRAPRSPTPRFLLQQRTWGNARVLLSEVRGDGPLALACENFRLTRIGVLLEEVGGVFAPPKRVDLRQLAEMTSLSQSQFCYAFKQSTGMPPYRWQLAARVSRAQALLLQQDRTIADIALATGFADQPHLTRIFKRLTGTTPSAWRRKHS